LSDLEYIESGILEAYVLDVLTAEERQEAELRIAASPALQAEVDAIEEAMLGFAKAQSIAPPDGMQHQIWDALDPKPAEQLVHNVHQAPSFNAAATGMRTISLKLRWQLAAAIALLFMSALANVFLYQQARSISGESKQMVAIIDSLQAEQQRTTALLNAVDQQRTLLADSSLRPIIMKSLVPGQSMAATIYWNKVSGQSFLAVQKMPVPPAGKQYQMWVIQGGKPVSMGVIDNSIAARGQVIALPAQIYAAEAFAISLENEGGSATPTSVQVLGALGS
jgi:anti-sigma-K factor RskA